MEISLIINGRKHTLEVDPKDSLLFILREQLELTGTKNGCSQGHCGACTVVMNDKAVKSCLIKPKKLEGTNIVTIEGISPRSPNDELHPIQKAFVESTAVQCGYCTPGCIMELYAFFIKNIDVSEEEIKSVLEKHLCRCTGLKPILKAALLAQTLFRINNSS
ncbi:MAG: (2Fe-2S)-binding protein [Candidatus Hodarchaeales archaeon]|jgi:carbon-monoxide dehydrogenase small subunit